MAAALFLNVADDADLVEALRVGVASHDGWVQAVGHVVDAELRLAGDGIDPRRALRGRWTLVSLAGPAAGPYGATLSRATANGAELVGGLLVAGRASGVTAVLLPSTSPASAAASADDDAEPQPERATPSATKPSVTKPNTAKTGSAPSAWAAIAHSAATAATSDEPDEDEDDAVPERGDRVQHFAFGLCDVLMVSGDRLKIRDLKGYGRIREISTDVLAVSRLPDRDGKRVFHLQKRG